MSAHPTRIEFAGYSGHVGSSVSNRESHTLREMRTVLDVLGDPESWPAYRQGGMVMPLLRGATILSVREAEPDEIRVAIDARGHILHSTFVVADRDDRQRLLEILQPGTKLVDCLKQSI